MDYQRGSLRSMGHRGARKKCREQTGLEQPAQWLQEAYGQNRTQEAQLSSTLEEECVCLARVESQQNCVASGVGTEECSQQVGIK